MQPHGRRNFRLGFAKSIGRQPVPLVDDNSKPKSGSCLAGLRQERAGELLTNGSPGNTPAWEEARRSRVKKYLRNYLLLLGRAWAVFATVKTGYSHPVDLKQYKTYSWIKVSVQDPLWEDRVTRAVDSPLSAKRWTKVYNGGDAAVAAYGSTKTQKALQTWDDGFGGGWFWHGGWIGHYDCAGNPRRDSDGRYI
jgi:hypothetical protein